MTRIRHTQSVLTFVMLLLGAATAHAQQAFEDKYVPAAAGGSELAPLPTIGIVPTGTAPLNPDVATQLTAAIQKQLEVAQDNRFEVLTRANGTKVNWAFVVRNGARPAFDAFTEQFADQMQACMHSLADDLQVAVVNSVLISSHVEDQEQREIFNAAGAQMLVNWKADRCVTARNDDPFTDQNRRQIVAASHGMLTSAFDGNVFNGQGLLDLIFALNPLFFDVGGMWVTEMVPRLHTLFGAGVNAGLLTVAETTLVDRDQRTFWDWVILVISTQRTIVRPFIETVASGCTRTVPELSNPFKLSRCVTDGRIQLIPLRVDGQDYTTVQRGTR